MPSVTSVRLTTATRWRRLALAIGAGGAIGCAAAYVRPLFTGPIHYETMAALFVALPLVCLALTLSLARVAWRDVLGWLVVELSAVCVSFLMGWGLLGPRTLVSDLIGVVAVFWLIAAASCAGLLIGWQRFRRPMPGPYCPGCGYCLIGAPSDRCPECGRDFDLRELGITRDELRPSAAAG